MLKPDTSLFLLPPGEPGERVLQPAVVVQAIEGRFTVELSEPTDLLLEGSEVTLFRIVGKAYMQQSARVHSVHPGGRRVSLEASGILVSAENRDSYRVSTITANLEAKLGSEERCWVLDASATGLSLLASTHHPIGTLVDLVLPYDGVDYAGSVVIQSARPVERRKIRYGVSCLDDGRKGAGLKAALPTLCMSIQRLFLQRLSGNR